MQRLVENGIEWIYKHGIVYTAIYHGWTMTIRKVIDSKVPWRLSVRFDNGGSICFDRQFYYTSKEARVTAKKLVDARLFPA